MGTNTLPRQGVDLNEGESAKKEADKDGGVFTSIGNGINRYVEAEWRFLERIQPGVQRISPKLGGLLKTYIDKRSEAWAAGVAYGIQDTANITHSVLSPLSEGGILNPFKFISGVMGYVSSAGFMLSGSENEEAILNKVDAALGKNSLADGIVALNALAEHEQAEHKEKETSLGEKLRHSGEKNAISIGGKAQAVGAASMVTSGLMREKRSYGEIFNGIMNIIGFGGLDQVNVDAVTDSSIKETGFITRAVIKVVDLFGIPRESVVKNWEKITGTVAGMATLGGLWTAAEEFRNGLKMLRDGKEAAGVVASEAEATVEGLAPEEKKGVSAWRLLASSVVIFIGGIISFRGDIALTRLRRAEQKAHDAEQDLYSRLADKLGQRIKGSENSQTLRESVKALAAAVHEQTGIQPKQNDIEERIEKNLVRFGYVEQQKNGDILERNEQGETILVVHSALKANKIERVEKRKDLDAQLRAQAQVETVVPGEVAVKA